MQKLLFISNFPFNNPMHGGQIRSYELLKMYKENGFEVKVIVIKPENTYLNDSSDYEFVVPEYELYDQIFLEANPYLGDFFCHTFVEKNLEKIMSKVGTEYDCVHCEMPWLFELGYAIKSQSNKNVKLIFGSENVEWQLKSRILNNVRVSQVIVDLVSNKIREIEQRAASNSDLILTVSEFDYEYFKNSVPDKIVLVRNGISKSRFLSQDLSILNQVSKNYFLFVGSAHMPNVSGFGEIFSHSLAFLPLEINLVIVGGVSTILEHDSRFLKYKHLNDSRIIRLNNLEEDKLNALILNANAILLPVVEGGGSNLKTAEALYSNRAVIATDKSFIGYENYCTSVGVTIANDAFGFAQAILKNLNSKQKFERHRLEALTWDSTLHELAERVGV